jgi:hypothetical protein
MSDTVEKIVCFDGYNRRNFSLNILKLFSGVSHSGGKPLPMYSTPEKNLFRCIPQWRKTSSILTHTREKNLIKITVLN